MAKPDVNDQPGAAPDEEGRGPRRWLVLLVAGILAVGAGWFAPRPWSTGPGEVVVTHGDLEIARANVDVGTGASVRLEGRYDDRIDDRDVVVDVVVEFPQGVPVKVPLTGTVQTAVRGVPIRPSLGDVRIDVLLPGGPSELVPVVKWDEDKQVLQARRRPPVDSAVVLGLLAIVVVLWITEVVPLWVTALVVPVVLVVTGTGTKEAALSPFFHWIIALFLAGFLMARAMRRVGLDHLAAVSLVTWGGRSPVMLFGAILGVSAFLSMWMSNTASTAVLLPIVLAVTAPLNSKAFTKVAVLGLAYAATIGGVGSAVGTPANPLAIEFLGKFADQEISFARWFAYGLPMVVLFVPVMGIYLWWRMGVKLDGRMFARARWVALREYARVRKPTMEQWLVIAVFAAVMVIWLTQTFHKLNTGIVALGGVVMLAILGKLRTDDLGKISWDALLTFGGGITLGVFMVQSGTSDWVATRLEVLAGLPPFVAITGVAVLALGLTAVASNTATAAMLVPLAIPLATVLKVDPVLLVIVVAIASSVDFALVIGTPPTMIAYSTRLFTSREIFRVGIVLDVIGIVILVTAVVGLWHLFGILQ